MMNYWGWGLGSVIFWVILAIVIIAIMRNINTNHDHPQSQEKTPLDILKERYAKGEIDKKQYEEMKKDLKD